MVALGILPLKGATLIGLTASLGLNPVITHWDINWLTREIH